MANKLGIPNSNNFVPVTPGSSMPAGTIVCYSGSIASFDSISTDGTTLLVKDGWAVCNGASVSQSTYSQLFTRLNTVWNNCRNQSTGSNYSNPTTGYFRIPDLRGTFLRGEGTASGYTAVTLGATQDDATAKNGLSASASSSSISGTAAGQSTGLLEKIVHESSGADRPFDNAAVGPYGNVLTPAGGWAGLTTGRGAFTVDISHTHGSSSVSGTAAAQTITIGAGDVETRPINVGVYYLIKLYDNLAAVDVYIPSASAGIAGLVDNTAGNTVGTPIKGRIDGGAVVAGDVGEIVSFTERTITAMTANYTASTSLGTLKKGIWIVYPYCSVTTKTSLVNISNAISTNNTSDGSGFIGNGVRTDVPGNISLMGVPLQSQFITVTVDDTNLYGKSSSNGVDTVTVKVGGYAVRIA